jgi:hypothetical protein
MWVFGVLAVPIKGSLSKMSWEVKRVDMKALFLIVGHIELVLPNNINSVCTLQKQYVSC